MVVDMELEDAKNVVLELMKQKEKIERDLEAQRVILNTNHVALDEPLVDSEGFPRADIDVYQVRNARQKVICLQNDHKEIMKKIEQGLLKVHSIAGNGNQPTTCSNVANSSSAMDVDETLSEPFLRVNLVSPGSPAEQAGIRVDDLIMEFGSINSQNFKTLKDIGELVEQSRYKEIDVRVKRPDQKTVVLTLIPRPWTGKGLLGCNVLPLETVER